MAHTPNQNRFMLTLSVIHRYKSTNVMVARSQKMHHISISTTTELRIVGIKWHIQSDRDIFSQHLRFCYSQ